MGTHGTPKELRSLLGSVVILMSIIMIATIVIVTIIIIHIHIINMVFITDTTIITAMNIVIATFDASISRNNNTNVTAEILQVACGRCWDQRQVSFPSLPLCLTGCHASAFTL